MTSKVVNAVSVSGNRSIVKVTNTDGNQSNADAVVMVREDGTVVDPQAPAIASIAAGETHIGEVGSPIAYIDVTLTPDTAILAVGDIITDSQIVASALRVNDGKGLIQSIVVVDEDDQGTALDLVFLSSSATLGTENAAPSISDANGDTVLGIVSVAAADFIDLGGVRIATKTAVGLVIKSLAGATSIYIGAICRSGTPTYTGTGLKVRIGILQG